MKRFLLCYALLSILFQLLLIWHEQHQNVQQQWETYSHSWICIKYIKTCSRIAQNHVDVEYILRCHRLSCYFSCWPVRSTTYVSTGQVSSIQPSWKYLLKILRLARKSCNTCKKTWHLEHKTSIQMQFSCKTYYTGWSKWPFLTAQNHSHEVVSETMKPVVQIQLIRRQTWKQLWAHFFAKIHDHIIPTILVNLGSGWFVLYPIFYSISERKSVP